MSKITKTPAELQAEFHEQLGFLNNSCLAFDDGNEKEAKRIALTLRVLLHTKGHQTGLLDHVSLKGIRFLSTNVLAALPQGSISFNNNGLTSLTINENGGFLKPFLSRKSSDEKWLPFDTWWTQEIVHILRNGEYIDLQESNSNTLASYTRKDIVLNVAETDGGAHVDKTLNAEYYKLSRQPSAGAMIFNVNGKENGLKNRPDLPSIRQIAFELLESLKESGVFTQ